MPTVVSTSVSTTQIIQDPPNYLQLAVSRALIQGTDVGSAVIKTALKSFGADTNSFYNFCLNSYSPGMPQEHIYNNSTIVNNILVIPTLVPLAIQQVEGGASCSVKKIFIGKYSEEAYARTQLTQSQIANIHNQGVGLFEHIPSYDSNTGQLSLYEQQLPAENFAPVLLNTTPYTPNQDSDYWYQIEYVVNSNPNTVKYFEYNLNQNTTYPGLNSSWFVELNTDNYMPIVHTRLDKDDVNKNATKGTPLETETNNALRKLGYTLDTLTTAVNENPDIGVIDDVFVGYAVDVHSNVGASKEYLHSYFKEAGDRSPVSKADYTANHAGVPLNPFDPDTLNVGEIADYVNQVTIIRGEFRFHMGYDYIETWVEPATIGAVGTTNNIVESSFVSDAVVPAPVITPAQGSTPAVLGPQPDKNTGAIVYSKQIATGLVEHVRVHGLRVVHSVSIGGSRFQYTYKKLNTTTESDFVIPLLKSKYDEFTNLDKTELAQDCCRLLIYALDSQHLDWFQAYILPILSIVLIVVALYFAQPQIAGALAAGTTTTLILTAKVFLISYIAGEAVDYFLEEVGGTLGKILAVIAAVVAAYTSGQFQGVQALNTAQHLLLITNAVTRVVGRYVAIEQETMGDNLVQFNEEAEKRAEEFKDAEALLSDLNITAEDLLQRTDSHARNNLFYAHESPDEFYTRTIHNANPGVVSLDMVQYYVEASLVLPKYVPLDN